MSIHSIPSCANFKEIEGYPGYAIGDDGSVWSCRSGQWKSLRPTKIKGYSYIGLYGCANRKMKQFRVHRLVLIAFVSKPPAGMQCRHLDGNKDNNHLDNLRWGTPKENAKDRDGHGTTAKGERQWMSKLLLSDVEAIRCDYEAGATQVELAVKYSVSQTTISGICSGRHWADSKTRNHVPYRNALGSRHPNSKLTEADVRAIRASVGVSQKDLADQYGVTQPRISKIINRTTWKHLD